jgi:hypothetical protein
MLRHQTALGLPTDFAKAAEPCDGCMQGGMRKPSVKNKTTAETHEPIEPGSKIFSVVGVDLVDLGVKADLRGGRWACCLHRRRRLRLLHGSTSLQENGFVERLKPFKKMVGTHNRTVGAVQRTLKPSTLSPPQTRVEEASLRSSAIHQEQNGRIGEYHSHLKDKARIFRRRQRHSGRPFLLTIADSFIVANKDDRRPRLPTGRRPTRGCTAAPCLTSEAKKHLYGTGVTW